MKNNILKFLLDLLFPKICFVCFGEGHYFCVSKNIKPTIEAGGKNCPQVDKIIYLFNYRDVAFSRAMKAFKYQSVREIGELFGRYLRSALDQDFFKNTVVIPVPLHRLRQTYRGFNQAEIIARSLDNNEPIAKVNT